MINQSQRKLIWGAPSECAHTRRDSMHLFRKIQAVRALWTQLEKGRTSNNLLQCLIWKVSTAANVCSRDAANQLFQFRFLKYGKRYCLHNTLQLLRALLSVCQEYEGANSETLRWYTSSAKVWWGTEHAGVGIKKGTFRKLSSVASGKRRDHIK